MVLVTIWQIVFEKIKDNDTDCEEDIKDIEDIKEPFLGNMKLCQFLEILVTVFIVTCVSFYLFSIIFEFGVWISSI